MPIRPKAGVKLNLKTAPISYSRSSKWAPNGPKRLKMAPKAPKGPPVRYGYTLSQCIRFGATQALLINKTGEKWAPNWP